MPDVNQFWWPSTLIWIRFFLWNCKTKERMRWIWCDILQYSRPLLLPRPRTRNPASFCLVITLKSASLSSSSTSTSALYQGFLPEAARLLVFKRALMEGSPWPGDFSGLPVIPRSTDARKSDWLGASVTSSSWSSSSSLGVIFCFLGVVSGVLNFLALIFWHVFAFLCLK